MSLNWILQWWNLIFILPLGLALLYLGVYVTTGMTFGHADVDTDAEGDVEADADADVDADADADVDADGDLDADSELDADADADADAHAEVSADAHHDAGGADHEQDTDQDGQGAAGPGGVMDLLVWLGAGRLPLSLLLMLFAMVWGVSGYNLNRILASKGVAEWVIPLISLPTALVISALFTRWIARLFARLLPTKGVQARSKDALVGMVGVALNQIDGTFGLVQVRSRTGELFQLPCKVSTERPAIAKDQRVLLVDYDKEEDCYRVVPDELGRTELKQ